MRYRNLNFIIIVIVFSFSNCSGQVVSTSKTQKKVGGPCEGCEAVFEYGNKELTSTDTLPDFEKSETKLKLTGTVFKSDGISPAENTILYIYQTNEKGVYETKVNEEGWGKRHGYIRGWIKTGKDGKYSFYTFRPAAYPNGRDPEHIHVTVKEPSKNEYYIDSFVFDDDPLLTSEEREKMKNRGGSGISKPILENAILTIHRNIILGKNIPNYE